MTEHNQIKKLLEEVAIHTSYLNATWTMTNRDLIEAVLPVLIKISEQDRDIKNYGLIRDEPTFYFLELLNKLVK